MMQTNTSVSPEQLGAVIPGAGTAVRGGGPARLLSHGLTPPSYPP